MVGLDSDLNLISHIHCSRIPYGTMIEILPVSRTQVSVWRRYPESDLCTLDLCARNVMVIGPKEHYHVTPSHQVGDNEGFYGLKLHRDALDMVKLD